jgi:ARG/rhodanese/phosphatase superfamily protein
MSAASWKELWSSINVGEGIEQGDIKIFPLYHSLRSDLDYQTLWEATQPAEGSKLRIEEVSPQGSVTDVKVVNEMNHPILVVEGELLIGAKQNRTIHTTILVGPRMEAVIPVACVEPGRWSRTHLGRFGVSGYYTHSKLRSDKLRHVAFARRATRESSDASQSFAVNQGAVWEEVGAYAMAAERMSPTGDVQEVYESLSGGSGKRYDFQCPTECCGVAVAVSGEIVGIDCFDRPTTMERLFPRLMQSYVLEALRRELQSAAKNIQRARERTGGEKSPPQRTASPFSEGLSEDEAKHPAHRQVPASAQAVKTFLREVGGRTATLTPSLALGEDLRAEALDWCGAALAYEGRILHAEVFPWGVPEVSQYREWDEAG